MGIRAGWRIGHIRRSIGTCRMACMLRTGTRAMKCKNWIWSDFNGGIRCATPALRELGRSQRWLPDSFTLRLLKMRYQGGSEAHLGDRVKINGDVGVIVASLDTGEFSGDYPKEEWEDLCDGVLVRTDQRAIVRFTESIFKNLVVPIRD